MKLIYVGDPTGKRFRLTHWARVEEASGLPFNRAALLARENFVYHTEPICRAVVTAPLLAPAAPLLDVFRALQHAFYVDGLDTTDAAVLCRVTPEALARAGHAVDGAQVRQVFEADATHAQTSADFHKARGWGIASFPALLLERDGTLHTVSPGYTSAQELRQRLQRLRAAA